MLFKPFRFLFLIGFITLNGCGGGGGGSDDTAPVRTGYFIDSAVQGLHYETDSLQGTTDEEGAFRYRAGEAVDFYVGDVFLGSAQGAEIVTPVSLVNGAKDETHFTVKNIARFLISLDDDGDAYNGIKITTEVSDALAGVTDIHFAGTDFDTNTQLILDDLALTLVTPEEAALHLQDSLLTLYWGFYSGTYTVQGGGSWEVFIDLDGVAEITITPNNGDPISLTINISTSGQITDGAGGSFNGTVTVDGTISGSITIAEGVTIDFQGSVTPDNSDGSVVDEDGQFGFLNVIGLGITFEAHTASNAGGVITWTNLSRQGVETGSLGVVVSETGALVSATFVTANSFSQEVWSYHTVCGVDPCGGFSVDSVNREVTFSDFSMPPSVGIEGNSATESVSLSGTLKY